MNIDKEEVVQRLCELTSKVGSVKFSHTIPHDCFCEDSKPDDNYFQFDEEVLEYIVDTVNARLREEMV